MEIFLLFLHNLNLQIEGFVEHPVPRWRVVHTCFLVYMCTHVNSVYPTFGSEMHILGLTFSLVVLYHCDECVPWRSSLFAIV